MNFAIVIHKDRNSDYGVTVPDLPGCFSAGKTFDEALAMAREAIVFHLEGLIEDGQPVPRPRPIEQHQANRDYAGGVWAVVTVDAAEIPANVKRINITMPQRVLEAVDRYARQQGETRSGLLTRAVTQYIDRPKAKASAKRRGKIGRGQK